jgi:hypothetical protein
MHTPVTIVRGIDAEAAMRQPLVKKDATDMKSLLGKIPHQSCVRFIHPRKTGHSHTGILALPGVLILDPDAAEGEAYSNG